MTVKIVKLTAANVEALAEMLAEGSPWMKAVVTLTKTTATFDVPNAVQVMDIVYDMQTRAAALHGKVGGPYAALHAVRRKVDALAANEIANEDRMRAASARVEAMRDSGALADGLAQAKARSDARAERDAASDPLVALLNSTVPASVPEPKPDMRPASGVDSVAFSMMQDTRSYPASISTVGARVHVALSDAQVARVMVVLAEQAAGATVVFRAFGRHAGRGRVAGRLIPLSKSGQRRPKRNRNR